MSNFSARGRNRTADTGIFNPYALPDVDGVCVGFATPSGSLMGGPWKQGLS